MKFIHVDIVNEQLHSRSDLLRDKYIVSISDMIHDTGDTYGDILPVLLAYSILKYDDPLSPWRIQSYNDILYLYLVPTDTRSRADMFFVVDYPIDEPTIVSTMMEHDVIDGVFDVSTIDNHRRLCVGSDILDVYDSTLPTTKGGLMKMLLLNGIVNDDNVGEISIRIDTMMMRGYIYGNDIIARSVCKIRLSSLINDILIMYPSCR